MPLGKRRNAGNQQLKVSGFPKMTILRISLRTQFQSLICRWTTFPRFGGLAPQANYGLGNVGNSGSECLTCATQSLSPTDPLKKCDFYPSHPRLSVEPAEPPAKRPPPRMQKIPHWGGGGVGLVEWRSRDFGHSPFVQLPKKGSQREGSLPEFFGLYTFGKTILVGSKQFRLVWRIYSRSLRVFCSMSGPVSLTLSTQLNSFISYLHPEIVMLNKHTFVRFYFGERAVLWNQGALPRARRGPRFRKARRIRVLER